MDLFELEISEERKFCPECKKALLIREFYVNSRDSRNRIRLGTYCKACTNKRRSENRVERIKKARSGVLTTHPVMVFAQHRCAKLREKAKKDGLECSIKWRDIVAQYDKQEGLCAVSKRPMPVEPPIGGKMVSDQMCLVRVGPDRNYNPDNFVLVMYGTINTPLLNEFLKKKGTPIK